NSFLISTPQTGVDSMLITYSMMNIYWAILRPIAAFVTGIAGGIITDKLVKDDSITAQTVEQIEPSIAPDSIFKRIFRYAFIDLLSDISRQLLLGIVLAVLFMLLIPPNLFTDYLHSPLLNMVIILVISVPLYVCATGSVPIAASFLLVGMSPGAVLVFLMAGPATNAATITVLWRSIGKKATLIYLATIIVGSMAFGIVIDYGIIDTQLFVNVPALNQPHVHGTDWVAVLSSILLIALLIFVESKKIFYKPIKNKPMNNLYTVEGMTCNHCKSSVEKNVQKLEGVTLVVADPNNNEVLIEGNNLNQAEIESTINELGFVFKGKKES
ncbi:MAG: permease, partial [Crocinitomix sp.]|nr:permease [Crocinitomix sp.]